MEEVSHSLDFQFLTQHCCRGKLGHKIFCSSVHSFGKMSILLSSPWGGTSFYPIRFESYLSWKIRVSLSNPRSTKNSFPQKLSSIKLKQSHLLVLSSLFPFGVLIFSIMTNSTKLEDKLEGAGSRESLLILEEEAANPEWDKDKAKNKKDLVKAKRIISVSIGSHMYHPWRLPSKCSMKSQACTKERTSTGRWPWEWNSRMWKCIYQKAFNISS